MQRNSDLYSPDCCGITPDSQVVSLGDNIVGQYTGKCGKTGVFATMKSFDHVGSVSAAVDPLFGALGALGAKDAPIDPKNAASCTHALLTGSPAIDTGIKVQGDPI